MEQENIWFDIRPLIIDTNLVTFKDSRINEFNLHNLSSEYKTISYTCNISVLIARNERVTLMHRTPDLCLIDQTFNIVHQTRWHYGQIKSMCWSYTLDRFIVVSEQGIFFVRENTMLIDKVLTILNNKLFACTCSDTSLFLSTYTLASSITEHNISPDMETVREWMSPDTCSNNEYINDIKYSNESLALLIRNVSDGTAFL